MKRRFVVSFDDEVKKIEVVLESLKHGFHVV